MTLPLDDGVMATHRLLTDIWLVIVVLSLAGVVGVTASWIFVGLVTVAGAARRDRLRRGRLDGLRGQFAETDLADIDDSLERILAQEHTGLTSGRGALRTPP